MAASDEVPNIMLIDVNMPYMDGYQTTKWLRANYPSIKLVALSMSDDERTIIRMLKAGCCSYLLKDIHPDELEKALLTVHAIGHYNSDTGNINYSRLLIKGSEMDDVQLTDRDLAFLKLSCSEMTYKEIAKVMNVTERAIEGYRVQLFAKLNVQSRVGLCMEALRRGLAEL